ncbi:hypothetical protein GCM10010171_56430 [Actinokineospora fastidiosa]|uniref:Uncharacterized protein n=1 Tax=Actinokineospora fastidiosa TaxID=1816 RepID=A0A918GRW2_9PSEU|nr:hypothetical protein GCM10010171_56430 [Actinokineospora fastidiosa]
MGPDQAALAGHRDWVNDIAFSPDGRTLASAGMDGAAMLWDAGYRTPVATLIGDSGQVNAVAFSPDGRTLAAATGSDEHPPRTLDQTVTLWHTEDRAEPVRLTGHTDQVHDIAFSPDGRVLASAGADGNLILWDVAHRTSLVTLPTPTGFTGSRSAPTDASSRPRAYAGPWCCGTWPATPASPPSLVIPGR